jgi:hypothetical protein
MTECRRDDANRWRVSITSWTPTGGPADDAAGEFAQTRFRLVVIAPAEAGLARAAELETASAAQKVRGPNNAARLAQERQDLALAHELTLAQQDAEQARERRRQEQAKGEWQQMQLLLKQQLEEREGNRRRQEEEQERARLRMARGKKTL